MMTAIGSVKNMLLALSRGFQWWLVMASPYHRRTEFRLGEYKRCDAPEALSYLDCVNTYD